METILMLATSTKLDKSDEEIKTWFAGLKPLPYRGPLARVWFDNFDVLRSDASRGFEIAGDVSATNGPLGMQSTLGKRIGKVDLSRAISFSRIGKE
jgi:hypothetical protein